MRRTTSPELLALVPIDRRAATPLHRQLFDGLRRAILDGLLSPGQRVPATRVLATELGVSRLTVLTAYEQLLHEGYLTGRVGSGTYVGAALPDDALRPRARPRDGVHPSGAARELRAEPAPRARDEGGLRPFRISLPALDAFPQAAWARIVARRARALSASQMAYGDPAGLGALRSAIASHVRSARAVRCQAAQVLVVSGSQAALRLCAAVLLAPGDRAAVEEPGYPGARVALAAGGATLEPVRVDGSGIDVEALHALGSRVRAVYVTPSHQYPLGSSMSVERRLALLDWARRRDAWILEDDYDSEYRYVSRPLAALQGMERSSREADSRVIYIGTFSKVLFPALRVGYLIVPESLLERFVATRESWDIFPPTLYQLVLADFINEGHFARHLRRMRGLYLGRREALLEGLARHCGDLLTVHNADAGLHVTTRLPPGSDDVGIVRQLNAIGLAPAALSSCYIGSAPEPGLLLGFGGSREPALKRASRLLGEVLERASSTRG